MASWQQELSTAVANNDLASATAILARDEVKINGNVERKEWVQPKIAVQQQQPRQRTGQAQVACTVQHQRYGMMDAPWHYAGQLGGRSEIVRAMAEADFDLDSYLVFNDGCRVTSLHLAALSDAATVKLLLELGADPTLDGNYMGYSGTPKEFAQKAGRQDIVLAMEAGVGLNNFVQAMTVRMSSISNTEEKLAKAEVVKARIDQKQEELRMIKEGIAALKSGLDFLTNVRMKRMRKELEETKDLVAAFQMATKTTTTTTFPKEASIANLCSVCFEAPRQVFICLECDSWVCGKCQDQLCSCPTCRQDLKVKPLRRSVAIERILANV